MKPARTGGGADWLKRSVSTRRSVFRVTAALIFTVALFIPGCSGLPFDLFSSTPSVTPTEGVATVTPEPLLVTPVETPAVEQPRTLLLWVPPQFDPVSGSEAGNLLKAQLAVFEQSHTGLTIEVRVKSPSGPGGLLESLEAASGAAPKALPALVMLPRSDLETAALKGLIYPYDGETQTLEETDWYDYARELGTIQGTTYGLPFAGDALVLMYRPSQVTGAPESWESILNAGQAVVFPAADTQGLFSLLMYQSAGGKIEDAQHKPALDQAVLTSTLSMFYRGAGTGAFPPWLSQYTSDAQAWTAFQEQRAHWLVTWSSRFLGETSADTTIAAIPSNGSAAFTLATGWVWALSEPDTADRELAMELANILVSSEFLKGWSPAAGYLPTRPSALAGWTDKSMQALIGPIAQSAAVKPSNDLLAVLGPIFENATLQMISRQGNPENTAQAAFEHLASPPVK